jgi:hypothetical protein
VRRSSQPDQSHRKEKHPPAPRRTRPVSACLPVTGHQHAKNQAICRQGLEREMLGERSNIPRQTQTLPESALPPADPPTQRASGCAGGAEGATPLRTSTIAILLFITHPLLIITPIAHTPLKMAREVGFGYTSHPLLLIIAPPVY